MAVATLLQGLVPVLSILLLRFSSDHITRSFRAIDTLWPLRQFFLAQLAVCFDFLPALLITSFTDALEGGVHIVHVVRRLH